MANAIISDANLANAYLSYTNLLNSDLSNTNLTNTDFTGAFLYRTNFSNAKGLTAKQIKKGKDWQNSIYDRDFRKVIDLPENTQK